VVSRDSSPAAEAVRSEERELLRNAIAELPTKLRVVVAVHYFDGLPLNEIARILGCRLGTVKSRLFNARKRLCQTLQRTLEHVYDEPMSKS
jgi:RNA polymerase sigma-70 factor (ECF subfamily)